MVIAAIVASLVMLVPLASLYRGDLRGVLNAARMGGIQRRGGRLESGLVVTQVALAVMIASGAALLARPEGDVGVSFKTSEGLAPLHVQTRATVLLARVAEAGGE